jgi:hypothetical protein
VSRPAVRPALLTLSLATTSLAQAAAPEVQGDGGTAAATGAPRPADKTTFPWGPRGLVFDAASRSALPRPGGVWPLLRDTPGVVLDRVDVGGSDTGQQSLALGLGDVGSGAVWTLDGVDVTDPAAPGFTSLYPDVAALAAVEVRTSALDVRVRTPGVQVGLLLPEPPREFSGALHLRGSGNALQGDNLPSELAGRPFFRNRTSDLLDAGLQAGGTVQRDRAWLWGAASRQSLTQQTFTEHEEQLRTTSFTLKGRLRAGAGALTLLATRGEKVHEDRDTGLNASPESRWRQSGPTHLLALQDQRTLRGVSLLARLAWLDGGFRLEPYGAPTADAYEDFRGVFRGSYYRFDTERRRVQGLVELTTRRDALGFEHELLAGVGYRRMPVSTHLAWPGNKVLGLERQSVFFRTFRLTGFALPTRDLDARSVHDQAEAYVQTRARRGRLGLELGLRVERVAGRSLASSVSANPEFPDLLPEVHFPGSSAALRWLDALPRAGVSWDAVGDGRIVTRVSYAAYASPLGSGDVLFDNPIGREYASLGYYWTDRNGDHSVQSDELDRLRGQLLASGLDPEDPASTRSPNVVDPDLRAPRTHELAAELEASLGASLSAGARFSYRRNDRVLWRPLRNLELGDYVARGSVSGRLFDNDYDVVYFAPASASLIVPGDGRRLANREGYRQDALALQGLLRGRAGPRITWQAWGAWLDFRERFGDPERAIQDPTPTDAEPLRDKGFVAARPGGLGRGDVFANARWTAGASVVGRLPWQLEASALAHARDGFPIPYFQVASTGDPTAGAKNVLVSPSLGYHRLPSLWLLDARLARPFRVGRGTLTAQVDVFNALDRATTLQQPRDVELPAFGRPREIVRPRLVRLGLTYTF